MNETHNLEMEMELAELRVDIDTVLHILEQCTKARGLKILALAGSKICTASNNDMDAIENFLESNNIARMMKKFRTIQGEIDRMTHNPMVAVFFILMGISSHIPHSIAMRSNEGDTPYDSDERRRPEP